MNALAACIAAIAIPEETPLSSTLSGPVTNQLIARLPRRERDNLMVLCEPVELVFDTVLASAGQLYSHAYFPLTGFISLLGNVSHHPPLELGLIGNEGMLGATLALGVRAAPLGAIVQGSGSAWRIKSSQLRRLLAHSPALVNLLAKYLYVMLAQAAQTTICTRFHEIEPRLARWLLMTHDRAHGARIHLTHQFLADMLGVQRSAITIAAGRLQKRKLIHYNRGEIDIMDRHGLEGASCECYAAVVLDYQRCLG